MKETLSAKKKNQEMKIKSLGCFFRNPECKNITAGELIDKCGLKGVSVGDAIVSTKHANFIINKGNATSRDITKLKNKIKKEVADRTGILLDEEIIEI